MIPAVRIPADAKIRIPIELKLRPGWEFDAAERVFVSDRGERFEPGAELPKSSKIVHKTPALAHSARATKAKLSDDERNLLRHLQVVLPGNEPPAKYLKMIGQWPGVAEASISPAPSLPSLGV